MLVLVYTSVKTKIKLPSDETYVGGMYTHILAALSDFIKDRVTY